MKTDYAIMSAEDLFRNRHELESLSLQELRAISSRRFTNSKRSLYQVFVKNQIHFQGYPKIYDTFQFADFEREVGDVRWYLDIQTGVSGSF